MGAKLALPTLQVSNQVISPKTHVDKNWAICGDILHIGMGQGGKGEGGTMIKGLAAQLAVEWLHCSKYVLDQIYTQHQTIVGDVISRLCPLDSHHMQLSPYSILTIGNV